MLTRRGLLFVATGGAGGALSGLTGVGAIMVSMLTGWLKRSQHRAHGTSLAIITFVAISGVAGYWRAGNIDWPLVLALPPGAIAGVHAGTRAMALKRIYGLTALGLGAQAVYTSVRGLQIGQRVEIEPT